MFKSHFQLAKHAIYGVLLAVSLWSCNTDLDENPNEKLAALNQVDLSYGTDPSQLLDIYLPAERSIDHTPILVYIHGGAWVEGSKEEFIQYREAFTTAFPEYAMVAINYKLYDLTTGSNKFPAQENDVIEAINYIQSKTDEWNISDQLIISGASAGGHLALLHAYKHQNIGDIKAVIAFFPPTDLVDLFDFSFITQVGLNGMLEGSPSDEPEAYAASSPITYVDQQSVPTIFFHGSTDTVVPISQSELLEIELKEAGVEYEFNIVTNQGHGFTLDTYPPLFQQAADFIQNVLN